LARHVMSYHLLVRDESPCSPTLLLISTRGPIRSAMNQPRARKRFLVSPDEARTLSELLGGGEGKGLPGDHRRPQ
jgi:hypothetical protein